MNGLFSHRTPTNIRSGRRSIFHCRVSFGPSASFRREITSLLVRWIKPRFRFVIIHGGAVKELKESFLNDGKPYLKSQFMKSREKPFNRRIHHVLMVPRNARTLKYCIQTHILCVSVYRIRVFLREYYVNIRSAGKKWMKISNQMTEFTSYHQPTTRNQT